MRLELVYLDPRVIEESALSKTAAAVAMLLAFGVGGKMIYKMLQKNGINAEPAAVEALIQDPEVRKEAERIKTIKQPQHPQLTTNDFMSFIEPFEGRVRAVYQDTVGVPTVGVGFNLNRSDASELLRSVGANMSSVLNGQPLNDDQINSLFSVTVKEAENIARNFAPNFDSLPPNAQQVLVSMAFNLGPSRLGKFVNLRAALMQGDLNAAADAMVDSRWFRQVGNRGPHHVKMMRGG